MRKARDLRLGNAAIVRHRHRHGILMRSRLERHAVIVEDRGIDKRLQAVHATDGRLSAKLTIGEDLCQLLFLCERHLLGLEQIFNALTALTGTSWVFEGRDRARYFSGGVKFLVPAGAALHPYVGGGVGAINFRRIIREQTRGNITAAYLSEFGSVDGVVDPTQGNTTRPMGEIAVGVGTVISHAYIDVGYRYRKAFHNVNDSFNISQVGVAAGVKF